MEAIYILSPPLGGIVASILCLYVHRLIMVGLDSLLVEIGLTQSEVQVYKALLSKGNTTVGPIVKHASVAYSKVYVLLDKLIEKGLVNYIVKDKTKYFSASDPKKLLEYLEKKKATLDLQIKETESVLPVLLAQQQALEENEKIAVYEGLEGLKTIYFECIDSLKDGDTVKVLGASFGNLNNLKYKQFFRSITAKRLKKKIKYEYIFNNALRKETELKRWQKMPLTKIRFLLDETPGSINIQKDRVMIIYWHKEMPKVFYIKSTPVAESFKKYFEVIWKQAKP